MGEVIHFEALRPGGAANRVECDMLISVTEAGKGRKALNCRFSGDVLDTLRWRAGDKLKWNVELQDDRQVWTFRRCDDDEENALTISGNKSSSTATVKRTVDVSICSKLFPNGRQMHTASLEGGDKITAVFVVKYEEQE